MSASFTVEIDKPIASAQLQNGANSLSGGPSSESGGTNPAEQAALNKKALPEICQALQDATNRLNEYQENIVKEQNEQIAKLSMEIARKIIGQHISEGNYDIETIIKEALKNSPSQEDLVLHLNPEDLAEYQKTSSETGSSALSGIKLVSDPNIGRAECMLESPKGIVESFIESQLEQIAESFKKV